MKKALITGISGQTGSHLADLLLEKEYEVHGTLRRSSSFNTGRIDHIFDKLHLHYADLSDGGSLSNILAKIRPDEIYHLGAQSHVRVSFDIPEYTADITGVGTLRLLEAIRANKLEDKVRFYQASSSELFGSSPPPQNEQTPFHPQSPYAVAKLASYWTTVNYRQGYGMFASNGVLFNHEGPRRGETFVTQKIVKAAVRILRGKQDVLYLGNLDVKRDWGYAGDYVGAMWRMLQQDKPGDYVIATGEAHSVKEFVQEVFDYLNMDWRSYIQIDSRLFRPTEVDYLLGDASKARRELGWEPKVKFKELVKLMVDAEYNKRRNQ